jgi:hypothetical protein
MARLSMNGGDWTCVLASRSQVISCPNTVPDEVKTLIGTLDFPCGVPDEKSAQAVYDNLDFMRGVQAFLTGMPATSVRGMCNGMDSIGAKTNKGFGHRSPEKFNRRNPRADKARGHGDERQITQNAP